MTGTSSAHDAAHAARPRTISPGTTRFRSDAKATEPSSKQWGFGVGHGMHHLYHCQNEAFLWPSDHVFLNNRNTSSLSNCYCASLKRILKLISVLGTFSGVGITFYWPCKLTCYGVGNFHGPCFGHDWLFRVFHGFYCVPQEKLGRSLKSSGCKWKGHPTYMNALKELKMTLFTRSYLTPQSIALSICALF